MKTFSKLWFSALALIMTIGLFSCDKTLCDNSCPTANDQVCDDGGEDALYHVCQLGTDCNDCGERDKPKD